MVNDKRGTTLNTALTDAHIRGFSRISGFVSTFNNPLNEGGAATLALGAGGGRIERHTVPSCASHDPALGSWYQYYGNKRKYNKYLRGSSAFTTTILRLERRVLGTEPLWDTRRFRSTSASFAFACLRGGVTPGDPLSFTLST